MISGLHKITLQSFVDHRGTYTENFNEKLYQEYGAPPFIQDDCAISAVKVLRGFHGDFRTWKLVHCPFGQIFSVIVDCRKDSPTYMRWEAFMLGPNTNTQLLLPPGCGNSILSLCDNSVYLYKQSTYYTGEQFTVKWNDPALNVQWPITAPILSERDANALPFHEAIAKFEENMYNDKKE